jgi:DNA replication factor GINS
MEYEDIAFELKKERESKEITPLSITFFKDVKRYLYELEEEIERCNNPRSREALMLTDELNTSIGRIEEVFSLRRNKIFYLAAHTCTTDSKTHKNYNNLLPEEKRMYDYLTQSGYTLKRELLDSVMSPGEEIEPIIQDMKGTEKMLVRILKDIPTFVGADGRNYTVKAEETLMLPLSNAQGLIKKNVAQYVDN